MFEFIEMNRQDAKDAKDGKEWLEIGKIVAPQGLDGEVRVYPNSDFPERFLQPGKRWLLCPGEKEPQPIELLGGRYIEKKKLYVVEIAGVEDCNMAEALRGCLLMVPQSDRPPLGEDEYHVLDLLGLEVFDRLTQELVGTVVDVIPAGNDLLEVKLDRESGVRSQESGGRSQEAGVKGDKGDEGRRGQGETKNLKSKIKNPKTVLIPFVKAIVPVVDLRAKRIEITPPDGLLEINN